MIIIRRAAGLPLLLREVWRSADCQDSEQATCNPEVMTRQVKKSVDVRIPRRAKIAFLVAGFTTCATPLDLDVSIRPGEDESVVVGFETTAGIDYVLHATEDLRTWVEVDGTIAGNGQHHETSLPTARTAEFYRVTRAAYWDAFTWDEYVWR